MAKNLNDFYSNLPGARIEFSNEDIVMNASVKNEELTRSAIIFGIAKDGPRFVPVALSSLSAVTSTFGGVSNSDPTYFRERSLARAAREVYDSGCNNIVVVRVNGTEATLTLLGGGQPKIILTAINAGSKYNSFTATVSTEDNTITITDGNNTLSTISWTASDDLNNLVEAINKVVTYTGVRADIAVGADYMESPITLDPVTNASFSGGTDDYNMSRAKYSDCLISGYRCAERAYGRYAWAAGAYVTVSGTNQESGDPYHYLQNMAQFCKVSTLHGQARIGFMAAEPLRPNNETTKQERVNILSNIDLTPYYMNDYVPSSVNLTYPITTDQSQPYFCYAADSGARWDLTPFMFGIVGGPMVWAYNESIGSHASTGIGMMIGTKCSNYSWSNLTRKVIPAARGMTYSYSMTQLNDLTGNRITTFSKNARDSIIVTDGCMMNTGYWGRLSTVDIFHSLAFEVAEACDQYIGEPANNSTLQLLKFAVEKILNTYQSFGAIFDATAEILSNGAVIDHEITVIILCRVPEEIKKIRFIWKPQQPPTISLSLSTDNNE